MWDSEENTKRVEQTVQYLTKGCKCKTGCVTKRCKCQKGQLLCGPSCQCTNCTNTCTTNSHTSPASDITDQQLMVIHEQAREEDGVDEYLDEFSDVYMDSDDDTVQFDDEVNKIMEQVFGQL